jgi:tetratricopeptide (TPR) repeat protein
LDGLIRSQPEQQEFWAQKIQLLLELGRTEEAQQAIDEFHAQGGDPGQLLLRHARALAEEGHLDEALVQYRRALQELPEQAERIYLLMATLLQSAGRSEQLAELWLEGVDALPDSRALRYGCLRSLVERGRIEQALTMARQADARASEVTGPEQQAKPAQRFFWELELVDLLLMLDHKQEAEQLLQERFQEGSLGLDASLWLARILLSQRRQEEAVRFLQQVIERWPQAGRAYLYLGDCLASAGDLSGGEQALRKAVQLEPGRPEFAVALVRLLTVRYGDGLSDGDQDSSRMEARRTIQDLAKSATSLLADDDAVSHMILGYAYRSTGDLAEAVERFEAAATESELRKEALLQKAICLDEMQQEQRALGVLEALHKEMPDDPIAANALGYFLADQGQDLPRAESLIQQALAVQPDNGAFLDSLGWVHYRSGRYAEAFDLLVQASNALPEDPTILEHLGLTLRALNKIEEAIRVLERALAAGADRARLRPVLEELQAGDQQP